MMQRWERVRTLLLNRDFDASTVTVFHGQVTFNIGCIETDMRRKYVTIDKQPLKFAELTTIDVLTLTEHVTRGTHPWSVGWPSIRGRSLVRGSWTT